MKKNILIFLSCTLAIILPTGASWSQDCQESSIRHSLQNTLPENTPSGRESKQTILQCGSKVADILESILKNPDEDVILRRNSAKYLDMLNPEPKKATEVLVNALKKDIDPKVRSLSAYGLSAVAQKTPETSEKAKAIKALTEAVNQEKEKKPEVRTDAVQSLEGFLDSSEDAIQAVINVLETDKVADVREQAAGILPYINNAKDENFKSKAQAIVIPTLIKRVKQDQENDPNVRSQSANSLSRILALPDQSIPALIEVIKTDSDMNVRSAGADGLGEFKTEARQAIKPLNNLIKIENTRNPAIEALKNISSDLQIKKDSLKSEERNKVVQDLSDTLKVMKEKNVDNNDIEQIQLALNNLTPESPIISWLIKCFEWGIPSHLLFWLFLIFVYPFSPQIQAIFFWNPWIRRIGGAGYVGLLLTLVPFLRSRLFAPFRDSLLGDAELKDFDKESYFPQSEVKQKKSGKTQPLLEAIPSIQDQIILEGKSGLGKSMFLRYLVNSSTRIIVYLKASQCNAGVIPAIQSKLYGLAGDADFLRSLIYSGAVDICIDGLNEVNANTLAEITLFVKQSFKGNIIMATQPFSWDNIPALATLYVLQPLKREHIEEFLLSRQYNFESNPKVTVSGDAYKQECRNFLVRVLDLPSETNNQSEENPAQEILSNPFDLTLVAQMIAEGHRPDLFDLQQQQYDIMAAEYKEQCLTEFPLKKFSKMVYEMRLNDQDLIPSENYLSELKYMAKYRMVLSRQSDNAEGKSQIKWYFRHDKVTDFFMTKAFLLQDKELWKELWQEHFNDPRFRGVYFRLAILLPLENAMQLREELIQYAAKYNDHTTSDNYIKIVASRNS